MPIRLQRDTTMLLLVGLGNPGPRYAGQRHNIGFLAIEAIVRRHGFGPWRRRFHGEVAEGRLGGVKVIALKPMTFMNESGRAVGEALRFYKLSLDQVLVLHDELDLAPGKARIKRGGGHAGHNGLRSIAAHIGPGFRRLRLGIGHPGHKDRVHGYVLSDFAKADQAWRDRLLDAVAAEAERLAEGNDKADGAFMSRVNQAVFPAKPKAGKDSGTKAVPKGEEAKPGLEDRGEAQGALARAFTKAARLIGSKPSKTDD
jgi:PTH1 family peptidyl-tRNA hydrolase